MGKSQHIMHDQYLSISSVSRSGPSNRSCRSRSGSSTPALRWLPGQGDLLDADAPQQQLAYGIALGVAVQRAQEAGQEEAAPPLPLDGVGADLQAGARHTLNWQRRWRELEAAWFDQPPR